MDVNALTWFISILVIIGFFVFDFFSHVKTPHVPSLKEAALWSVFYIVVACIYGGFYGSSGKNQVIPINMGWNFSQATSLKNRYP